MTRIRVALMAMVLVLVSSPSFAQGSETGEYFHADAIGSVRLVTDANGQVVQRYDYLPFGEPWGSAGLETRRFVGKERDTETGLDYVGARYYASGNGRFTTVDPLLDIEAALVDPQRWNRYTYALNNPLKFTDPDGRDPRVVGAIIGVAVYTGWNVYVNVQQGRLWYQNIGIEASKGLLAGVTLGLAAPVLAGTTTAEIGLLTATGSTIAGPLGTIARSELDRAINAGGQTIELVTKLSQSPAAGRALSAAGGEGAQALAAASRAAGNL